MTKTNNYAGISVASEFIVNDADESNNNLIDNPVKPIDKVGMDKLKEDSLIILTTNTETIEEAYGALSKEQKSFYDVLKSNAMNKPLTELYSAKYFENVRIGKQSILKLKIKRKTTVAVFAIENEELKKYLKDNKSKRNAIKIKATEIFINDLNTLQAAIDMTELAYISTLKEREEVKELRKSKRKKNVQL